MEKKDIKSLDLNELKMEMEALSEKPFRAKQMYEWILNQGYQPIIIATKLDKVKKSQTAKQLKCIKEGLQVVKGTKVIPFSAETKAGRDEIYALIEELLDEGNGEALQ